MSTLLRLMWECGENKNAKNKSICEEIACQVCKREEGEYIAMSNAFEEGFWFWFYFKEYLEFCICALRKTFDQHLPLFPFLPLSLNPDKYLFILCSYDLSLEYSYKRDNRVLFFPCLIYFNQHNVLQFVSDVVSALHSEYS